MAGVSRIGSRHLDSGAIALSPMGHIYKKLELDMKVGPAAKHANTQGSIFLHGRDLLQL